LLFAAVLPASDSADAAETVSESTAADCRSFDTAAGIIAADTLDVLTLNVGHARGTALNQIFVTRARHQRNLNGIAALLKQADADVVALQEADAVSLWSGRFDHVEFLSEAVGYRCYVHGHHADTWLYTFGTALMSRGAISDAGSHAFRQSPPTTTKGFVQGTIEWRSPGEGGTTRKVTLISIHLDFSRKKIRDTQVAELIAAMSNPTKPLIVLGDMNEDWNIEGSTVRKIADGLGLRAFSPEASELGTYKQTERIDWILISEELAFVDYAVLPDGVSDHRGLLARIGWAPKP
jgi:endonuclease/exonuclease/phosphatase family metal-dependent hydrolase